MLFDAEIIFLCSQRHEMKFIFSENCKNNPEIHRRFLRSFCEQFSLLVAESNPSPGQVSPGGGGRDVKNRQIVTINDFGVTFDLGKI